MYANNLDVLVTIFVDKDLPNVGFPYILFTGTTKDREESLKQIMLSFRHCPNYLSSPISGKLVHKCCTLVLKFLLRQPYFKSEVKNGQAMHELCCRLNICWLVTKSATDTKYAVQRTCHYESPRTIWARVASSRSAHFLSRLDQGQASWQWSDWSSRLCIVHSVEEAASH